MQRSSLCQPLQLLIYEEIKNEWNIEQIIYVEAE